MGALLEEQVFDSDSDDTEGQYQQESEHWPRDLATHDNLSFSKVSPL